MTEVSPKKNIADDPIGFRRTTIIALASVIRLPLPKCAARAELTDYGSSRPCAARVLEILLQEHRALGAYAILDRLREDGFGSSRLLLTGRLIFLS